MQQIMSRVLTALLLLAVSSKASAQHGNKNDLTAPTGLTFSYTSTALIIDWPAVNGALRYSALRRQGTSEEQLGNTPTNQFVLPPPARGVAYEYQITAIGKTSSASSAWVPYTAPLEVTAVLVGPITSTATGMVTYAGPAELTAVSPVPGQIRLWWSEVPNATGYRVVRSSTGGEVDRLLKTTGLDAYGNVMHQSDDVPVDFRWTYSYKIYALVKPGGTEILTAPSPVASARSLPFVQVSGLTYTLIPSTKTPGRLDAHISWNAVTNVLKYIVYDETWAGPKEFYPPTTGYVQPGNRVGDPPLKVCVGAIYPGPVAQDATMPCIEIKF